MLDRTRLVIERRLGTDPVDPLTNFEEGDLLQLGADGWAISASATAVALRGVAGINKQSALYGVVIDEEVVLVGVVVTSLAHGNISNVKVADLAGTPYTITTDYLIDSAPNGTLHRVALGGIADGETVLVSYTYEKTLAEMEEDPGADINNSFDETLGSGNVVVFQGNCLVGTTRYDTSQVYAISDPLYDNGDGLLTSDASGGKVQVGYAKNVPSASDPYLVADLNL